MRFEKKSVVVTGAGAGMGKEITLRYLAEGAHVTAADYNVLTLRELETEVSEQEYPGELRTYVADISKREEAENLFPSIHCLVSWMCCIGLRGCDRISKWYKWVSKFIAVLVFISTLALRQHVLIDVAGGILLAELACYISNRRNGYKLLQKVTETATGWIAGRLSGKKNGK